MLRQHRGYALFINQQVLHMLQMQGEIENLTAAGIPDSSQDLVISNCVVSLFYFLSLTVVIPDQAVSPTLSAVVEGAIDYMAAVTVYLQMDA